MCNTWTIRPQYAAGYKQPNSTLERDRRMTRRLQFHERSQRFIRSHDETPFIAMCVGNERENFRVQCGQFFWRELLLNSRTLQRSFLVRTSL